VKNPGAVKLKLGSTLVDALAASGDVLERPEKLTISLQRGPAKQALAWNDVKTSLKDGDIILVERLPVAQIYVNGQVKSPGTYELPEGAGVLEALTLAGGTLDNAALNLVTIVPKNGAMRQLNLAPALVHGQVKDNPKLIAGDTVIVPQITDQVVVLGDVNRPGALLMSPERPMTVLDAIGLAGGQTNRAKLTQVSIIRAEGTSKKTIVVNVNDILKKRKYENNITLQPFDVVYVPGATKLGLSEIIQSAYYVMVGVRP
jgi:protein involved in polysaccharide export with SLBB domain